jgi:hypothetical protein
MENENVLKRIPVTGGAIASDASIAARSGLYGQNRAPLKATSFLKLPPGVMQPRGWLRRQLDIEIDGLCGRMPDVSHYMQLDNNGWVDHTKGGGARGYAAPFVGDGCGREWVRWRCGITRWVIGCVVRVDRGRSVGCREPYSGWPRCRAGWSGRWRFP